MNRVTSDTTLKTQQYGVIALLVRAENYRRMAADLGHPITEQTALEIAAGKLNLDGAVDESVVSAVALNAGIGNGQTGGFAPASERNIPPSPSAAAAASISAAPSAATSAATAQLSANERRSAAMKESWRRRKNQPPPRVITVDPNLPVLQTVYPGVPFGELSQGKRAYYTRIGRIMLSSGMSEADAIAFNKGETVDKALPARRANRAAAAVTGKRGVGRPRKNQTTVTKRAA